MKKKQLTHTNKKKFKATRAMNEQTKTMQITKKKTPVRKDKRKQA